MAVGTTALSCYQKEDVSWEFTVTDPNVASITGWTIAFVVKAQADDVDPPLLSAVGTVNGTLTFLVTLNIDVAPGLYVYGARRTDAGFSWELATAELTVLDTPSEDV